MGRDNHGRKAPALLHWPGQQQVNQRLGKFATLPTTMLLQAHILTEFQLQIFLKKKKLGRPRYAV